ncbi:MAG: peptidoglycan-binding protein, partial [Paracoccaceae bacterium]|nr:peptidoglycan-binding protein [Paracoccaceae bacterium]
TDNMDVAIASALLLTALGEPSYAELIGHHLTQGFGTTSRPDLALDWFDMSFEAAEAGARSVVAPGQPERIELVRQAAYSVGGRAATGLGTVPVPAAAGSPALPNFEIAN